MLSLERRLQKVARSCRVKEVALTVVLGVKSAQPRRGKWHQLCLVKGMLRLPVHSEMMSVQSCIELLAWWLEGLVSRGHWVVKLVILIGLMRIDSCIFDQSFTGRLAKS